MAPHARRHAAVDGLAAELHWRMEDLEPSGGPEWAGLSDRQRSFYRLCVRHLLEHRVLIAAALRDGAAGVDVQ